MSFQSESKGFTLSLFSAAVAQLEFTAAAQSKQKKVSKKMENKASKMNQLTERLMKFGEIMGRFSTLKVVEAIQKGMQSITAPIIIGSLFLILNILATPSLQVGGHAILPFLTPLAKALGVPSAMTLGFIGLLSAFTISKAYSEILGVDTTQGSLIGLLAFFFINFKGADSNGNISTAFLGTSGLFVAMVVSLLSVKIYSIFIKSGFTIKLPSSVPPAVGNAFAALLPTTVVVFLAWLIRTVLDFNFPEALNTILAPLLNASDSIWSYILITLFVIVLWSIGLNGPAMLGAIITPITTANLTANAAAKLSGDSIPHIWTNAMQYSFIWLGSVWPIVILYILSKNRGKKAIGTASAPALIFNIIEPTMFGSPVAMNPILMIPFIFNGVVGCAIGYLSIQLGFVARPFVEVPWPTPPFISGLVITGDWKILIVQVIVLAIGLLTFYPFVKADISQTEKLEELQA